MPNQKQGRNNIVRLTFGQGLWLFFAITYWARPDALQMLHWWPICFWTPVVLLPFVPFFWRYGKGPIWVLLLWIGLVVWFDAAWRWPLHAEERRGFRLVTLNCAEGDAGAMREALAVGANIVLIQEVAGRDEVKALAKEAGYLNSAVGLDCAVLSKGPLVNIVHDRDFMSAEVGLGSGSLRVISLRLRPPVFRLDYYNPAAWTEYREDAKARRQRISEILKAAPALLIGGDFNSTNPTYLAGFTDSHEAAGRGWPGTGTNEYPFARVDQIWGNRNIRFLQSYARRTENSDHRMVIADFEVVSSRD